MSVDRSGLAGVLPGEASEPPTLPCPGLPLGSARQFASGRLQAARGRDHCETPRIIRTQRPCVVLPDLMMLPGPNCIALTETVPDRADIPVIFIPAYGRNETGARALPRSAGGHLVKPFSATELTARI